jgi:hypothetical protein
MANETNPNDAPELPAYPGAPWATMATALAILFVFAGLVVIVLYYSRNMGDTPVVESGEQQLKELRAQQRDILDNYGYDQATKSWRIPIDQAMAVLVEEGKSKGDMYSFPAVPRPKDK